MATRPQAILLALLALLAGTAAWAAPGDVLFSDDFERASLGADWSVTASGGDAGISDITANSGTRSMYLRWDTVSVTSRAIDLSAVPAAELRYWVRRGSDSFDEWPENANEDLVVEYLDSGGTWRQLALYPTGGPQGEIFNAAIPLPADALHAGLRLRFTMPQGSGPNGALNCQNDAGQSDCDYWHVDDVQIVEQAPTPPVVGGFCDDFESGLANWTILRAGGDAGTGTHTALSPTHSLYLRWGVVSVTSRTADLSGLTTGSIQYWVRRGDDGFSEDPDGGEDLVVEYYSSSGTWVVLDTFTGAGTPGQTFFRSYALPADARHPGFRLRFRMTGGSGSDYDYWHVDDVCLGPSGFPAPTPLAHYAMEEPAWNGTSGEVKDGSGNGNHGTAVGGADTTPDGKVCRGGEIPANTSSAVQDAIDTGLDVDTDIGRRGTVAFWYRARQRWENGARRMLFDASTEVYNNFNDKYFFLQLDDGRLEFRFEDGNDADFEVRTGELDYPGGTWVHIAVTWDFVANRFQIYVNGALEAERTFSTNGVIPSELGTLYLGDNRSGYHPGGTGNSADGTLDEAYIYSTVLTRSQIQTIMNATHSCAALAGFTIDVGTGSASTCTPHAVTITAQNTAGGTFTGYTGTISLSTSSGHGTWSVNTASGTLSDPMADDGAATYTFVAADSGTIVLDLANVHADDLTITVSDASAGVSSTSAVVRFRDNAFVVTPTTCTGASCPGTGATEVVAGRGHGFQAALWRRDPSTGNCAIATAYDGTKGLKAWIARNAADPGGAAPAIAGAALPNAAPAANNLTLAFTAGVATFTLDTTDVGKYAIALRDDTSGFARDASGNPRPIDGGSEPLTVRPFALGFTDINAGATANPGGTAASGAGFTAAGRPFAATVGAYLWQAADDADNDGLPDGGADVTDNGLTPSYAWATTLTASLHTPAGGVAGTLGGTTSLGASAFGGGKATVSDLTWSEAGSMRLQASATGFLNTSGVDVSGTSPVIGRFYPDRFALVSSAVTPADASGNYSYMGQPFTVSYTLEAQNAAGGRTRNYDAGLYTVGVAAISHVAENADDGNDLSARLTVAAASWGQGLYTVNDTAATFARAASPDGPFDQLAIGVKATGDPDGVQLSGLDMNAAAPGCGSGCDARTLGTTRVRYGRLAVLPAFGSELIDLNVPVRAEYYDGTAFAPHTDDGATTGVSLSLSDPDTSDTLTPADTCAWDPAGETGIACTGTPPAGRDWREPPSGGDFNLWLRAPGKTGDLVLTATVPAWLRYDWDGDGSAEDPSARVSFGIFRGDEEMIFRREVY